jgi:hypothetical protein
MAAGRLPFVVHEGGGGPERAEFVCGFLGCDIQPFNPVLATLPRLWRVRRSHPGRDDLLGHLNHLVGARGGQDQELEGELRRGLGLGAAACLHEHRHRWIGQCGVMVRGVSHARAFDGVAWSTSRAHAETEARLRALGCRVAQVAPWFDGAR